jgi:hypothetical protein
MTDFAGLLRCLAEAGVEYVVVGGAAATAHGSARLTQDLDVVYRRTVAGTRISCPTPPRSSSPGLSCQVLALDSLIRVKRAAGRPKDLEAVAELEAIREERARPGV